MRDAGNKEYLRFNAGQNADNADLSPGDSRCLNEDDEYRWLARAYDLDINTLETAESSESYSPANVVRTQYVNAMAWKGGLYLSADVRPGSRDLLESIDITGPNGFSYTIPSSGYTLPEYWWDASTETRLGLNEWYKYGRAESTPVDRQ